MNEDLEYNPDTGIVTWKQVGKGRKSNKEAGSIENTGYRRIRYKGKAYLAHRLAWYLYYGKWPDKELDHINRNRQDNRIENLREVSSRENSQNTENFKGTHFDKGTGKWRVRFRVNGKMKHIGLYETEELALNAYRQAVGDING